jgi:hypothetical protein
MCTCRCRLGLADDPALQTSNRRFRIPDLHGRWHRRCRHDGDAPAGRGCLSDLRREDCARNPRPADVPRAAGPAVAAGTVNRWFPATLIGSISVAASAGVVLQHEQGFWVPLTVAFVYRPEITPVPVRARHRIFGTVSGVLIGVLPATALHGPVTTIVIGTAMAAALPVSLVRNYAIFTASMTTLILLKLNLVHSGAGAALALARFVNSSLGCLIAIVWAIPIHIVPGSSRSKHRDALPEAAALEDAL